MRTWLEGIERDYQQSKVLGASRVRGTHQSVVTIAESASGPYSQLVHAVMFYPPTSFTRIFPVINVEDRSIF
jgi:hypothetical protein